VDANPAARSPEPPLENAAIVRLLRPYRSTRRTDLGEALAEGVGFEPTIRFPVYTLSKRAPSATRPSLRLAT
jgi:hypothetical protein